MNVPKAYKLIRESDIGELGLHGFVLEHVKSGARLILLPAEDDNKVFAVAFRTPPVDDTGIPHILEHSVLCGSDKYPVKDPFVELMKTSPNTFLNALTYPDKTVYPVASVSDKDFANLMDVYLDAVFHPRIHTDKRIFLQEGWRYELEKEDAELQLNGVVYSEMKGAFSAVDDMLDRYATNSLYLDTAYGFESGGDPQMIPSLSYEKFREFHKRLYHPANSYIYLYGNCDMEEKLEYMDREYLSCYDRIDIDSALTLQPPFESCRSFSYEYPVADEAEAKDGHYLSLQWAVGDSADVRTCCAMNVLDQVLLQNPGAPLKQALLDAGIGKDISGGYGNYAMQPNYMIVAKNCEAGKKDEFLRVAREALEKLAEEGINRRSLRAAISSFEFSTREADFGGMPKGLIFGMEILKQWLYDREDPFRFLRYEEDFRFLREQLEQGYFEELIRRYFLNNTHCSIVEMLPVPGKAEKDDAALKEKLAAYKASLTKKELKAIVKQTKDLKKWQETPDGDEALATIPKLRLSDMNKAARKCVNNESEVCGIKLLSRFKKTAGIVYLGMYFDLEQLSAEDLPWLGLYRACFGSVSTKKHGYADLYDLGAETFGGLTLSLETFAPLGAEDFRSTCSLSLKALYEKLPQSLEILGEVLRDSLFTDKKRMKEIIDEQAADLRQYFITRGHTAAMGRAASYMSKRGVIEDLWGGLSYFRFLTDLEEHYDERADQIAEKLTALLPRIFTKNVIFNVTAEEKAFAGIREDLAAFADSLKPAGEKRLVLPEPVRKNEGIKLSGAVNYVALTGNYKKAGAAYTGALRVLSSVLSSGYLWQQVRVQGGAYGSGCAFRVSGDGMFMSFRDPNLRKTLENYRAIPDYLEQLDLPAEAVEGYVISTIGTMDMPLTPSMCGETDFRCYFCGLDNDWLQKERDEVLGCTNETLKGLAEYVRSITEENNFCVFGSGIKIEEDRDLFLSVENL